MQPSGTGSRWKLVAFAVAGLMFSLMGGATGALLTHLWLDDGSPAQTFSQSVSVPELVAAVAAPSIVTIVSQGQPQREGGRIIQSTSIGSGVIMDRRGFVVTNEHVIRGAARVTVVLTDGQERRGTVVSQDQPFTDLAVVRIEGGGDYPVLSLGDSDALRLGEPLVVIGHSLRDLTTSVTSGIVSGLHRDWPRESVVMEDLIQTDAAVNHGNSGGALLNRAGELVGINTTVVREDEDGTAVEGIGFAIPSNTVRDVALSIIDRGRKLRPFLGIQQRDISPEQAVSAGLPPFQGALVVSIISGSPAERAGLKADDLIVSIGGKELTPERPYLNNLMRQITDKPVELIAIRNGARVTVNVTLVLQ